MRLCILSHVQVVTSRATTLVYIQEREYIWCYFHCVFFFLFIFLANIISKCALTRNKLENRARPDKGPRERWILRGWCRTGLVPHTLSHHTLPTFAERETSKQPEREKE